MASNVELIGLARDLAELERNGNPVRLGLIGCGEMGTDIISRVAHMDGISVAAVAELAPENAVNSVEMAYGNIDRCQITSSAKGFDQTIDCLLYTSPSPRDKRQSRMPSSA